MSVYPDSYEFPNLLLLPTVVSRVLKQFNEMEFAAILRLGIDRYGSSCRRGLSSAPSLGALGIPRMEAEVGVGWKVVRVYSRQCCEVIVLSPVVLAACPVRDRRGDENPIMWEEGV